MWANVNKQAATPNAAGQAPSQAQMQAQMQKLMGQQMMGGGQQMMAQGQVPGGAQFQFFPIQVGGPTPYARSRRLIFMGVVIFQLLMALMALIEFANILSGVIMILGCLAALWALKEDMNITYICWWGCLSTAGFIAGLVGALIGFAVKISTIVVKFNIPLSCFFGMTLAWWLYTDYEAEHPESNDMVASWLRAFGLMKPKVIPAPVASNTLLSGNLPMFGGGNVDSMKAAANQQYAQAGGMYASYKDQAMAQANSYGALANDQYAAKANSYGGLANDQYAAAQAKAAEAGNVGGGWFASAAAVGNKVPRDVRRDPFLTQ